MMPNPPELLCSPELPETPSEDRIDMLVCSICQTVLPRPSSLAHSKFAECPFVCENCRCKDCSIVLDSECDCGERHADRSRDDPRICTECVKIRHRIAHLDPDLLRLRDDEIAKEDPVYGSKKSISNNQIGEFSNE